MTANHSVINISGIIEALRSRNYSTGAIARAAQVDVTTIWRWENGRVQPKLDAVNRLLSLLNERG